MIKTFIMFQKISVSDKCCSSELSVHQRNLNNSASSYNKCVIRMIYEGSCDWRNYVFRFEITSKLRYILLFTIL